jgi:putative two-component system response regulator
MTRAARILVVDDEEPNRKLLRDILTPLGYEVREAIDGEQALSSVAREIPDLVLLDVMMPLMNGYDVCKALKSNPLTRLVPVVMVTTLDDLYGKLKAVDLGADEYLGKPFNMAELTTRVRSLLSLKRFTDDLEHASRVLESIARVVEGRDSYTGDHCKRLGDYAARVGKAMGLPEEDLKILRLGGIFHDLGKIAVSDAILNKPGGLTAEEFELIKGHPATGSDLCRGLSTAPRK